MASFERLAKGKGDTRIDMLQRIKDMDLDMKPKKEEKGSVTKGDDVPKGPNKYSVPRKSGENLKDHMARVKAAREKEGLE